VHVFGIQITDGMIVLFLAKLLTSCLLSSQTPRSLRRLRIATGREPDSFNARTLEDFHGRDYPGLLDFDTLQVLWVDSDIWEK